MGNIANNNIPGEFYHEESRRIGQYDDEMNLIAEYVSATVAAKAVGSNRTSIRNCANGKQKHAGGYIWRYLDQQNDQAE